MRVLWDRAPLPAYDIVQELQLTEDWHANTIKTMLTRLGKKGAITSEKYKNLFIYSPAVTEDECVAGESASFLDRVFGGSIKPLLVHFANNEKFTTEDIDELKKILKEQKRK